MDNLELETKFKQVNDWVGAKIESIEAILKDRHEKESLCFRILMKDQLDDLTISKYCLNHCY